MSYKIDYVKEQDYIVVTIEGSFALSTLKELAENIAQFSEQYGCNRILNDMRQAELVKGTTDIYNMPKTAKRAGVDTQFRRALVVKELSSEFYFLETVFINQGHNVRMFMDIDEALHWLLDKENPKA
jgi:hypothetical protein